MVAREKEFGVRAVAGHPGDLQGVLRAEMQGALNDDSERAAGGENDGSLRFLSAGRKIREGTMDASTEVRPRLDIRENGEAIDPHGDYGFK